MTASGRIAVGLGWAALITASEWLARRALRSRAQAWLVAYGVVGAVALTSGGRLAARSGGVSIRGLTLAAVGYPLGRRLFHDAATAAPPDGLLVEMAAIEVVATVEELTWGGIVEPALGRPITAGLFAAKHAIVDGRWRRTPALFAFWIGLSAQRRRWPVAALAAHLVLNAAGVIQGHLTNRDRF